MAGEAYQAWHDERLFDIRRLTIPAKLPISACVVVIKITFPDRRRSDLTNKAESIMDLLVDAGVLEDDSHDKSRGVMLFSNGVDSERPMAEITIYY